MSANPAGASLARNKIQTSKGDKLAQFLIYFFVILFALVCLVPFILVIIVSFTEEKSITINGYSFFPAQWSLDAYQRLFSKSSNIPRAYQVTGFATIVGTLIASLITFGAGYTLCFPLY